MKDLIFLSLIVLVLMIYCVQQPVLKVSFLLLLCVFCWGGLEWGFWQNGFLLVNSWNVLAKALVVLGALSIFLISPPNIGGDPSPVLMLLVALGSLLLISSSNFLSMYLAIELPTLSLFILVAQKSGSGHSAEAGLKYFILGALASGLFLFGCALIYGLNDTLWVPYLDLLMGQSWEGAFFLGAPSSLGHLLVVIALLFKLSAAPFHMWAPDVYEGAPTAMTALLATVPKMGIFSILASIGPISHVLWVAVVSSMVMGAMGGLNQTKVKSLLAYSAMAHLGFILWGLEMGTFESVQASLMYFLLYMMMSVCGFGLLLFLGGLKNLTVEFGGLSKKEPVLAMALGLIFFSMAGVPPLIGFFSKWWILSSGVCHKYFLISILAVLSSVVAGAYYLKMIKTMYFQKYPFFLIGLKALLDKNPMSFRSSLLMGLGVYLIGGLMLSPNFLLQITHWATMGLF